MTHKYDSTTRPTPLRDAGKTVGGTTAIIGAALTFLASWGVLSADQSTALAALLALIPTAVTLVVGVLTAFGVVARAEPLVTPVSRPQDNNGVRLVPEEPPLSSLSDPQFGDA